MCLAIPGKLISKTEAEPILRTGRVSIGGIVKDVNLAFVPEATVGDYVVVHAGVAIGIIDENEAQSVFNYLAQIDDTESTST